MARKFRLGGQLFETSANALDKVQAPSSVSSPASPYQANLMGADIESAKMAGTPAQTRAARQQAAAGTTLREAIRYPQQELRGTESQFKDLRNLGRVDEALAAAAARMIVPQQQALQITIDEDKIIGLDRNQKNWVLANEEKIRNWVAGNLGTEEPAFARQVVQNLGENINLETVQSWVKNPSDVYAENLVETNPDKVTFGSLEQVLTSGGTQLDSFLNKFNLSETQLNTMLGPEWKNMTYKQVQEFVQDRRSQFADVEQLTRLLGDATVPAFIRKQAADQMKALGYTGATAAYDVQLTLEEQIVDGYTISVGGAALAVDDVLSDEFLSLQISQALAAGEDSEEMENLRSISEELYNWVSSNASELAYQFEELTGETALDIDASMQTAREAIAYEDRVAQRTPILEDLGFDAAYAASDAISLDFLQQVRALGVQPAPNSAFSSILNLAVDKKKGESDADYAARIEQVKALQANLTTLRGQNMQLFQEIMEQPLTKTEDIWREEWVSRFYHGQGYKWVKKNVKVGTKTTPTAIGKLWDKFSKAKDPYQVQAVLEEVAAKQNEYETRLSLSTDEFLKEVAGYSTDSQTELITAFKAARDLGMNADIPVTIRNLDANKDGELTLEDFDAIVDAFKEESRAQADAGTKFLGEPDLASQQAEQKLKAALNDLDKLKERKDYAAELAKKKEADQQSYTNELEPQKELAGRHGIAVPALNEWSRMSAEQRQAWLQKVQDAEQNRIIAEKTAPAEKPKIDTRYRAAIETTDMAKIEYRDAKNRINKELSKIAKDIAFRQRSGARGSKSWVNKKAEKEGKALQKRQTELRLALAKLEKKKIKPKEIMVTYFSG